MNKRLLGPISVCLTAASLSLARGEPPARFPLGATLPPVAEPSAPVGPAPTAAPQPTLPNQKTTVAQQPAAPAQAPATDTGTRLPNRLMPIPDGATADVGPAPGSNNPLPVGGAAAPARPKVDLKDDHIGPVDRYWLRGEYLYWWIRNGPLRVPLLMAGDPITFPLGLSDLNYDGQSGGRLTGGLWLDDLHQYGVEASAFALNRGTVSQAVSSDANGNPALARPILAASVPGAVPTPTGIIIAAPGVLSGGMSLSSSSRLWGAEANFVRNLFDDLHLSGSLLFGFRYLSLEEDLEITQTSTVISPVNLDGLLNPLAGFSNPGTFVDSFRTQNYFYGGQIGGRLGWRGGIWAVDVETKVALGTNHEAVNILGTNTLAGATQSSSGGFLALATNSGKQAANWFVVVPEVCVQVGCQLNSHWRAHVGYDFLYMNSVVRAGAQVNPTVNPGFLPPAPLFPAGPREPAPLLRQNDFWAHGITAGVTFTY
jgi:hypothetical protein